jgi:hypothetical protein
MRSPVIVIGKFAIKIARDSWGRASNLYEANLYRSVNETRRALLCPVLWVSRQGVVQIMRSAEPLTEMMSEEAYQEACEAWDLHARRRQLPIRTEGMRLGMVRRPNDCLGLLDSSLGRPIAVSWSQEFDDPIPLPRGDQLITLQDAANYIGAAEGRAFLMHARVGMMRALNRHVERVFDPNRKDPHWDRRKLKRVQ